MSEEAANAKKAVPYGIVLSIGSCWVLGFIIMIVIAACINPDLNSVATTSFGQPMAQVRKFYSLSVHLPYPQSRDFDNSSPIIMHY